MLRKQEKLSIGAKESTNMERKNTVFDISQTTVISPYNDSINLPTFLLFPTIPFSLLLRMPLQIFSQKTLVYPLKQNF